AAIGDDDDRKVCQCQTDALCAGFAEGLTCDLQSAVCVGDGTGGGGNGDGTLGEACEGDAQSTCDYGQFCDTTCQAAPQADESCQNFANGPGINWSPESGTGPVIYSVTSIAPWDNFCSGTGLTAFTAKVLAYHGTGTFPANKDDLSGFFYVRVDGEERDATLLMNDARYRLSNGGKNGEFDLTVCADATNSIQVGLYFTSGNEVCSTVSR
ncbi:MAG TPA: hypothetical protein VK013_02935, partial [Myxococcaceae bacterium]|nr:hypothetical protein [Myxococcaceae bacterium]